VSLSRDGLPPFGFSRRIVRGWSPNVDDEVMPFSTNLYFFKRRREKRLVLFMTIVYCSDVEFIEIYYLDIRYAT